LRVTEAEFITGAVSPAGYPPDDLPEVAFAGRSNVGKSTLINALLNRHKLCRTSSTPGKTQEINFYRINGRFNLVDLPGYGYARVPLAEKRKWGERIETYLSVRPSLKLVVILVDIRHEPSVLDRQMVEWTRHLGRDYRIVATKADKLSRSKAFQQVALFRRELGGDPVGVSAHKKDGLDVLWKVLREVL